MARHRSQAARSPLSSRPSSAPAQPPRGRQAALEDKGILPKRKGIFTTRRDDGTREHQQKKDNQ
jgi:hypothetical protein